MGHAAVREEAIWIWKAGASRRDLEISTGHYLA
jgi:hypothetical protein